MLIIPLLGKKVDKMSVLLSIKPKYCERIKNGNKKYEFRKVIFKRKVSTVYIYSSSPVKKIIGKFSIGNILNDSPSQLWKTCNGASGLSEDEFFNYFAYSDRGYALKIDKLELFDPVDPYTQLDNFVAPQSFCYVNPEDWI